MQQAILFLILVLLTACTGLAQSATPTPFPTPYPTPTLVPSFQEAFLKDLQQRIKVDDTIPDAGRKPIISLIGQQPTYVFPENPGIVLQYLLPLPDNEPEIKKASLLLIGTGVVMAQDHKLPPMGN